jgi:hypothetical protein
VWPKSYQSPLRFWSHFGFSTNEHRSLLLKQMHQNKLECFPLKVLPASLTFYGPLELGTNVCREKGSLLSFVYIFGRVACRCCKPPPSDIILAQLACPLSDVMFWLHSGIPNLSLHKHCPKPGNTKGGSITVLLTSCFDWFGISCMTTDNFVFICQTDYSKPVKQEVNGTMILPPLVFPART